MSAADQRRLHGQGQRRERHAWIGGACHGIRAGLGQGKRLRTAQVGTLLQQQGIGPHHGQTAEGPHQRTVRQGVDQRAEKHSLMVRHVTADNAIGLFACAGRVGIDAFVKAVRRPHAQRAHVLQGLQRLVRRIGQGKRRSVGGVYAALRIGIGGHGGEAEGEILVIELRVKGIIAAFADAPQG